MITGKLTGNKKEIMETNFVPQIYKEKKDKTGVGGDPRTSE